MADLLKAKQIRSGHRTHVKKLIGKISDVTQMEEAKTTLAALAKKQIILEKCDSNILEFLTESDEIDHEIEESSEHADSVIDGMTKLQMKIDTFNQKLSSKVSENHDIKSPVIAKKPEAQLKLPKYDIKKYDGSLLKWNSFWEQFEVSVNSNGELSDIKKFIYLKSYLTGEAERAIQSLSLSEENYKHAIELLNTRFGNKQARISAHMKELRSIQPIYDIKNVAAMRKMYDTLDLNINNLRELKVDVATYSSLLISIIFERIPEDLRIKISLHFKDGEWNLQDAMEMLKDQIEARERSVAISSTSNVPDGQQWDSNDLCTTSTFHVNSTMEGRSSQQNYRRQENRRGHNNNYSNTNQRRNQPPQPPRVECVFCKQSHLSSRCRNVTDLNERFNIVKRENRCFVCLKKNHRSRDCRLQYSCIKCNQKHSIALCNRRDGEPPPPPPPQREMVQNNIAMTDDNVINDVVTRAVADDVALECNVNNQNNVNNCLNEDIASPASDEPNDVVVAITETAPRNISSGILLKCARADVCSPEDEKVVDTSIIFDDCSQRTFITDKLRTQLNLPCIRHDDIFLRTFGSKVAKIHRLQVVEVGIKGRNGSIYYLQALCVPYVCSRMKVPTTEWIERRYNHFQHVELAFPPTDKHDIDILVGMDHYYDLIIGKVCRGLPGDPVAVESILGWIVCGPSQVPTSGEDTVCNMIMSANVNDEDKSLKFELKKFWEIEEMADDELEINDVVLKNFNNKIHFNGKRYVNPLPFKSDDELVPDHYNICYKRLQSIMQFFERNPKVFDEYMQVFRIYESEGIIEKVFHPGKVGKVHYMPHRPVIRLDKETSKYRPVFDGSCKEKGGMSLNDLVYPGPSLLGTIFDIIIRFSFGKNYIISDITKAFHNFEIAEEHKDYLRFIFVDLDDPEKLQTYRFSRGCFGVNCMSFLMSATVNHHMNSLRTETNQNELIDKFLRDLYMDDVTTTVDNVDEGKKFYEFAKTSMKSAGFELRKWESNSEELRKYMKCEGERILKKILGLVLNTDDEFVFDFEELVKNALNRPLTKKTVLSVGHKFFDPAGLIAHLVIVAKVFFQKVCMNNLKWDEKLSDELANSWIKFLNRLSEIKQIRVPRYVFSGFQDSVSEIDLCGFCDASKDAYCAVIYVRAEESHGVCTRIVTAKTKVAPMKKQSIPRLELLSCMLSTQLMNNVCKSLENIIKINNKLFWSDSEVALAWVKGVHKQWTPWVENRVKKVRKKSNIDSWHYVNTHINPADIGTRGDLALKDPNSDLWWYGPKIIREKHLVYDDIELDFDIEEECVTMIAEVDPITIHGIGKIMEIERFSSLQKLLHATAYSVRFIEGCERKERKPDSVVEIDEAEKSLELWIKYEQFLIRNGKNFKQLKKQLNLMEDENGILRLKGRLENSHLPYDAKHPILLDRNSYFTKLVILDAHEKVLHLRMKSTLNELRTRFWICSGRKTVSATIKDCVTCLEAIGTPMIGPAPPDLPDYRVSYEFAFSNVGVDYAGPLLVKDIYATKLPGTTPTMHKAYICLFTCATTRMVHIELCPNMGVPALIRLFTRFIKRRGKCNLVISDNFKTFLSVELKEFISRIGVRWSNILDKAPWWGAFYERLIRIIKETLRKTLGKAKITYEELETVLIEIEAIMNDRPLTYIYEEVDEPLTPSHLVIGKRLNTNSNADSNVVQQSSQTLNARFEYLQSLIDLYWKRFTSEYLTELHQHHINSNKGNYDTSCKLLLGDVVLIKDDAFKRNFWKKGRVEKLIYGKDEKVRGALLRTPNGSYIKRPVQRIVPLEVQREHLSADVIEANKISSSTEDVPSTNSNPSYSGSTCSTDANTSPTSRATNVTSSSSNRTPPVFVSSRGRQLQQTDRYQP